MAGWTWRIYSSRCISCWGWAAQFRFVTPVLIAAEVQASGEKACRCYGYHCVDMCLTYTANEEVDTWMTQNDLRWDESMVVSIMKCQQSISYERCPADVSHKAWITPLEVSLWNDDPGWCTALSNQGIFRHIKAIYMFPPLTELEWKENGWNMLAILMIPPLLVQLIEGACWRVVHGPKFTKSRIAPFETSTLRSSNMQRYSPMWISDERQIDHFINGISQKTV